MSGNAFGAPGNAPTWSSSDKDFVTTGLGNGRLWATIGHGIINEIYWPSTGRPQVRDLGFYLFGDAGWIDLKRVRRYRLSMPKPTLPPAWMAPKSAAPYTSICMGNVESSASESSVASE